MVQIRIEIDERFKEPEVVIRTSEVTERVNEIVQKLSVYQQKMLAGFLEDRVHLIDTAEIVRLFSTDRKIIAQTKTDEFVVRLRLYELEERLDGTLFVRISNSEIVNLKAIQRIDLSIVGTITILLSNGTKTFVSRRYVTKIKQVLGI